MLWSESMLWSERTYSCCSSWHT